MSELKQICNRLDTTILQYFIIQDEVFSKQAQLEQAMRGGLLSMAKARYSMGTKAVSATQYDRENMEASFRVLADERPSEHDESAWTFSITKVNDEDAPSSNESSVQGLRKRKLGDDEEEKDLDDEKVSELTDRVEELKIKSKVDADVGTETATSSRSKDPLTWFGVLVPQALRECQCQFRSAVSLSADLATLKVKLLKLQTTIRHLLHRKEEIINSFDDSGFVIYDDSSLFTSQGSSLSQSTASAGQVSGSNDGADR